MKRSFLCFQAILLCLVLCSCWGTENKNQNANSFSPEETSIKQEYNGITMENDQTIKFESTNVINNSELIETVKETKSSEGIKTSENSEDPEKTNNTSPSDKDGAQSNDSESSSSPDTINSDDLTVPSFGEDGPGDWGEIDP